MLFIKHFRRKILNCDNFLSQSIFVLVFLVSKVSSLVCFDLWVAGALTDRRLFLITVCIFHEEVARLCFSCLSFLAHVCFSLLIIFLEICSLECKGNYCFGSKTLSSLNGFVFLYITANSKNLCSFVRIFL